MTPMPTISAMAIVRGASTSPVRGIPKPTASKSAFRTLAKPIPARIPSPDARAPIASASLTTTPSTCRRVAPSARSIANSRIRWATVIEKVLKMMNAPTRIAAPASASSAGVRKRADLIVDLVRLLGGVLLGRLDLGMAGKGGLDPVGQDRRVDPRGGEHARPSSPFPEGRTSAAPRRAAAPPSSRRPARSRPGRRRRCR